MAPTDTRENIRKEIDELLRFLDIFDQTGGNHITAWRGGPQADGSLQFPYPEYRPEVIEFFQLAGQPFWSDYGYNPTQTQKLKIQVAGIAVALGGLVGLFLPGLSAPPLLGSLLMLSAGIAWGVYSQRGKGACEPIRVTAGNFIRAVPVAAILSLIMRHSASLDGPGLGYAITSGAVTSGLGYAVWYMALPSLRATDAATVQLSVPVIAALGGIALVISGKK